MVHELDFAMKRDMLYMAFYVASVAKTSKDTYIRSFVKLDRLSTMIVNNLTDHFLKSACTF